MMTLVAVAFSLMSHRALDPVWACIVPVTPSGVCIVLNEPVCAQVGGKWIVGKYCGG